jgi:hypothetical protein
MDSMNIKRGGMWSKLVSPIIASKIKKKTGVEADLDFGIETTTDENGKTHIHIDVVGELSEEGWKQLKKAIGVPSIF